MTILCCFRPEWSSEMWINVSEMMAAPKVSRRNTEPPTCPLIYSHMPTKTNPSQSNPVLYINRWKIEKLHGSGNVIVITSESWSSDITWGQCCMEYICNLMKSRNMKEHICLVSRSRAESFLSGDVLWYRWWSGHSGCDKGLVDCPSPTMAAMEYQIVRGSGSNWNRYLCWGISTDPSWPLQYCHWRIWKLILCICGSCFARVTPVCHLRHNGKQQACRRRDSGSSSRNSSLNKLTY